MKMVKIKNQRGQILEKGIDKEIDIDSSEINLEELILKYGFSDFKKGLSIGEVNEGDRVYIPSIFHNQDGSEALRIKEYFVDSNGFLKYSLDSHRSLNPRKELKGINWYLNKHEED